MQTRIVAASQEVPLVAATLIWPGLRDTLALASPSGCWGSEHIRLLLPLVLGRRTGLTVMGGLVAGGFRCPRRPVGILIRAGLGMARKGDSARVRSNPCAVDRRAHRSTA